MRDIGLPKVMTWRWAPCAALVLGSLSFVGFALLVIPERIGDGAARSEAELRLGQHFAANRASVPSSNDWSGSSTGRSSSTNTHVDGATPESLTRIATHGAEIFPKRGFSPPLERAEPPPPPPPPPAIIPPPAVAPPPEAVSEPAVPAEAAPVVVTPQTDSAAPGPAPEPPAVIPQAE